jgi:hypothetical protein
VPNSLHAEVTHDGPRNAVFNIIGVLDDGDLPPTVVVDIERLYVEPNYKITRLRLDTSEYFIEAGLTVEFLWEADPPMHVMSMSGKGQSNFERAGGRQNTTPGFTGNLMLCTKGWFGERKSFSIALELVKQFT